MKNVEKRENARVVRVCARGVGSLKASLARVFSRAKSEHLLTLKRIAFTMAEILLSLTIIGVVAAITLPSLTGNINERTWNTQRKALYSRLSQAISLMPQIRGYGDIIVEGSGANRVLKSDNATDVFVSNGLAKVFKLNNICDSEHLGDCGLPEQINTMGAEKIRLSDMKKYVDYIPANVGCGHDGIETIDTKASAFETANGESVLVHYNPTCNFYDSVIKSSYAGVRPAVCANFVYDLNGKRGPNTVGKDIGFMSLLYADRAMLAAPDPVNKNVQGDFSSVSAACRNQEARLPNLEEAASIFVNSDLMDSTIGIGTDVRMWTSTSPSMDRANQTYVVYMNHGAIYYWDKTDVTWMETRCVKR